MTLTAEHTQRLLQADPDELRELLCKQSLGVWTQEKMRLPMSPLHWEWCRIRQTEKRIAVVAPREHAKSETFTVNGTAWESIYTPGLWTYIFAQTFDQSKEMLQKVRKAIMVANPDLVRNAIEDNKTTLQLSNYAKIQCAGAGKATRGVHPDVIVGDDVLSDGSASTLKQREDVRKWFFGAVGGMAHPGTTRTLGEGKKSVSLWFPPSRVYLVGTPFHQQDLLMDMRKNPVWRFRRYAAEFHPDDLVPGTMAVEVG
ncbi:terminase large subunit, ATPase domain [Arthrobacter phage DanielleIgnace]|nr:terminase large subunit, ATPase domain [Arthrobacter phage DanielleIgnace]